MRPMPRSMPARLAFVLALAAAAVLTVAVSQREADDAAPFGARIVWGR